MQCVIGEGLVLNGLIRKKYSRVYGYNAVCYRRGIGFERFYKEEV